jgi:hypothetical protein
MALLKISAVIRIGDKAKQIDTTCENIPDAEANAAWVELKALREKLEAPIAEPTAKEEK